MGKVGVSGLRIFLCALMFFCGAMAGAQGELPVLEAQIFKFSNRQQFRASTQQVEGWDSASTYAVVSEENEIIAFAKLVKQIPCQERLRLRPDESCIKRRTSKLELIFEINRYRGTDLVFVGDKIRSLNLDELPEEYTGNTDLLVRTETKVSSRYKPLVTQGIGIGPTAAQLGRGEQTMSILGIYSYGISDRWSVTSIVPANILGAPNLSFKYGLLQAGDQSLAAGFSMAKKLKSDEYTLSVSLYWDSVSGEKQISHTALNIALGTWEFDAESENLTLQGSSTIQTGYEFILRNWDRLLVGPRYNFQRNAVGGYLGYKWIWDYYHLLVTMSTADITNIEYSSEDGYFLTLDMYWRF